MRELQGNRFGWIVVQDATERTFEKFHYAKEYYDVISNKYNLLLNDIDDETSVSHSRVVEYAGHRVEVNPEDNGVFEFDTLKMTLADAVVVINYYGEAVEVAS